MATIGNFIPTAPEISNRYINAAPLFDLRFQKFQRQIPLTSEDALKTRTKQAVEGYRSKKLIANLVATGRNIYKSLQSLAMREGVDLKTIMDRFTTKSELAFANPLLAQIGVPPQSVSVQKIKDIITKGGNLEDFLSQYPETNLRDSVEYLLSEDKELENMLKQSVEERFNELMRTGIEEPPEGSNKRGVFKWYATRGTPSRPYYETFLAPQSSLYQPGPASKVSQREVEQIVLEFAEGMQRYTSPSTIDGYIQSYYNKFSQHPAEPFLRNVIIKTIDKWARAA